ncbi:SH3 domain-containing protein [Anaerovibrio sp.]|uniref:SH3 domain-containing protein n=1 Tax=Anaerovibrio sp. TaxID=1872532 RepID=UPI0025B87161|nr:SH3 domain-containing protein [Anaerovibrio sp.]MBR2142287.1 SH3 domain-containing protein [Anaerovibrio sp.]
MKSKGIFLLVFLAILAITATAFADYTKIADNTVPAYTNSALTKRNGNERVDKGDRVTVHQETPNAYYVTYPVRNGTKTRWVPKNIFNNVPQGSNPKGYFDGLVSNSNQQIRVTGWAFDRDNVNEQIHVHVYIGGPAGSGEGHDIIANKHRPDVGRAFAGAGDYHGFDEVITTQRAGKQEVYIYAINVGGGQNIELGHKTVDIKASSHNPMGYFDGVVSNSNNTVTVTGWALDKDDVNAQIRVHIYIGGPAGTGEGHDIHANKHRPDVNQVYAGTGEYHGFNEVIKTNRTGRQEVYAYAINIGGGNNTELGHKTIDIKSSKPIPAPVQEQDGYIKTNGARLNFRVAPNGAIIDKINNGTSVKVLAHNNPNGWSKIRYNGREGYVSSQYISPVPPIPVNPVSQKLQQLANGANGYKMGTKYTGSGQCRGFANMVYLATFQGVQYISGYTNSNYSAASIAGSHEVGHLFNFGTGATAEVKALFMKARPGAFVQMGRRYTLNSTRTAPSPHSAILYSVSDGGVQFYEANTDGKNTIKVNTYSWAELAQKNKGFTIYEPNNYALK